MKDHQQGNSYKIKFKIFFKKNNPCEKSFFLLNTRSRFRVSFITFVDQIETKFFMRDFSWETLNKKCWGGDIITTRFEKYLY